MNNFYYTCVFGLRDLERKEREGLEGYNFLCLGNLEGGIWKEECNELIF